VGHGGRRARARGHRRGRVSRAAPAADLALRPQVRFAVRFAALAAALLALYYFPHGGRVQAAVDAYLGLYARATGAALRLVEPGVRVIDRTIVGRASLQIVKTCDAMDVTIVLIAAIVAGTAPWRRKVLGILAGVVTIVFFNIIRLCTLYFVAHDAWSSYDFIHLELWPVLLLAVVIGFYWLYSGRPSMRAQ
jgi:exosortase/archaeosortase family protein